MLILFHCLMELDWHWKEMNYLPFFSLSTSKNMAKVNLEKPGGQDKNVDWMTGILNIG